MRRSSPKFAGAVAGEWLLPRMRAQCAHVTGQGGDLVAAPQPCVPFRYSTVARGALRRSSTRSPVSAGSAVGGRFPLGA